MPHREAALAWLANHSNSLQCAIVALLCVIARAFYSGAEWRKVAGDVIFCPLLSVLIGNRIPEIVIHGFHVDHVVIAALVGTAGMHGVRLAARWAAEKRGLITKTNK
ncbi:phage holin family protein [Cronobacter muytjensii]|uniref:phage holin family protein n=1 Tax=Cronobacter muytjensii TaxID=413501 RepID=UPI002DB5A564|nr:phage holin family protein [Cronobacter muytjensii]MEB8638639.1 phage holin family protein [Cronobacter muytjensii]